MNKIIAPALAAVALIILGTLVFIRPVPEANPETNLGAQIRPTVTNTNVHVNSTSTQVVATSTGAIRVVIQNGVVAGGADAWCAFGATPTSTTGLLIAFASSSPHSRFDTTDPSFLSKQMLCVGSTTLSLLYY
jgi:hypothetical protein